MSKFQKQAEATKHIRQLISQQCLNISSRNLTLEDNQRWVIFEHNGKQVGIDSASGVWIRKTDDDWHCIALPCNVSSALQVVDFLTSE
jgi:hypothetical protein